MEFFSSIKIFIFLQMSQSSLNYTLSALYQSDIHIQSEHMGRSEWVLTSSSEGIQHLKISECEAWMEYKILLFFLENTHGVKLRSRCPLPVTSGHTSAHLLEYFFLKAHPERNTCISLLSASQTKPHRNIQNIPFHCIKMQECDCFFLSHLLLVCTFHLEVGRGLKSSQCRVQLSGHGWRL